MSKEYKRPVFNKILKRINEKRNFIQILTGPRQAGKTTLARQIMNDYKLTLYDEGEDFIKPYILPYISIALNA